MYQPQDVSVIICGYTEKRWDDIREAIQSVQQQTRPPQEIIFVADHNPKLLELIREHLPGVRAIENTGDQGASASRNSGVAVSEGQIVAFLDDDAIAEPDWLEKLCEGYRDSTVLGVGGKCNPQWLGPEPTWMPEEFYWVVGATYRGMPETTSPVRNLWTGNLSIRREVFESVDGFRTGFGKTNSRNSPEDTDLCIRINQRWPGGIWLYKPDAEIWHKIPSERTRLRHYLRRCYNEGLGKADLARLVGASDGMDAERSHALKQLPLGVFRNVGEAITRRDGSALVRAVAIVAGLGMATAGYVVGTLQRKTTAGRDGRR